MQHKYYLPGAMIAATPASHPTVTLPVAVRTYKSRYFLWTTTRSGLGDMCIYGARPPRCELEAPAFAERRLPPLVAELTLVRALI